ncbi:aspartyl-trna synthetase [Diplodia corticola]|uniref:Probable aspartate--tRNA ligase, cytoplasmic n=1 Tax=Diplodia corticola TaxID=236234 RepID=A0A1J9S2R6_9PEZI|nr:aspartyl-trna synthetase [Diplodia corticola]OJD33933.1 aspartyl-trna synthetase [Diplodia corticola]
MAENAPPAEGAAAPSKNALKKAQKEAEKAAKKAAAKERELAERLKQGGGDAGQDVSKEDYGELPMIGSVPHTPSGQKRAKFTELKEQDEPVVFRCTVINARSQSAKLAFLNLRQGDETIQAVVAASEKLSRQMVKFAGSVSAQSIVLVHGLVRGVKEPIKSATLKNLEVHIQKLYIISKAEPQLPLQVEDAERPLPEEGATAEEEAAKEGERPRVALATRLDNRVLDLRATHNRAIFGIKSGICALYAEFMHAKGFTQIQTPKLLGAASEGGSNVFECTYFDRKAYLAQSPQLYKQMLVAGGFERVFEVGPVFRAENSNTARHLTEFTGLDMEMAFEEDYHEVVDLIVEMLLFIFKGLRERYSKETDIVREWASGGKNTIEDFKLPEDGKVPIIPFKDGVKMLREAGEELGDYEDLSTPQEKLLGKLVLEKYGSDFYVLDQFPLAVRPFYTMPSPHDPQLSNSYDMFMRGQEIMSGAQRVHDPTLLIQRCKGMDPPVDPSGPGLKDYVDGFRYGCPPHAGGGFGLERIVSFWAGVGNVRLASLFPRDPQRILP